MDGERGHNESMDKGNKERNEMLNKYARRCIILMLSVSMCVCVCV